MALRRIRRRLDILMRPITQRSREGEGEDDSSAGAQGIYYKIAKTSMSTRHPQLEYFEAAGKQDGSDQPTPQVISVAEIEKESSQRKAREMVQVARSNAARSYRRGHHSEPDQHQYNEPERQSDTD